MIYQAACNSFKAEVAQGLHNFTTSTGNVFKLALYTSSASLSAATTAYTTTGEITGTGYTAGGKILTNVTPINSAGVGIVDFADAVWTAATFTARGGLIYNSTNSNRAVLVLDFGSDRTVTAGTFTVTFPEFTSSTAIIRLQ